MPHELLFTPEAQEDYDGIGDNKKRRKVDRCLAKLENNPHHPGLNSHRYDALDSELGETVWESYVENQTPSAWRVWWFFGPDRGQITVVMIGPHP